MALVVTLVLLAAPGCTQLEDSSDEEVDESVEIQELIQGCTDPEAENYNSEAEEDDGVESFVGGDAGKDTEEDAQGGQELANGNR